MAEIKCPWCGHDIDIAMDSCGTGTTWSLFKCRSCGKFAASGNVPDATRNDPDVRIVRIFGYQDNYAVGYPAGSISNFAIGYIPELAVTTGAAHTAIGGRRINRPYIGEGQMIQLLFALLVMAAVIVLIDAIISIFARGE